MRLTILLLLLVLLGGAYRAAAGEHVGEVTFGGVPLPGVAVTALSGDRQLMTTTDEHGRFRLIGATPGVWTIRVEMLGFDTMTREVTVGDNQSASAWTLTLKSFDDIAGGIPAVPPPPGAQI